MRRLRHKPSEVWTEYVCEYSTMRGPIFKILQHLTFRDPCRMADPSAISMLSRRHRDPDDNQQSRRRIASEIPVVYWWDY